VVAIKKIRLGEVKEVLLSMSTAVAPSGCLYCTLISKLPAFSGHSRRITSGNASSPCQA
jgi:hypothetical protein